VSRAAPALLVLALALAAYSQLLTPGSCPYSPHSDLLIEHLATKQALFESMEAGRGLPVWREDIFSGAATLSNPQSMFTYPVHLPFLVAEPAAAAGPVLWLQLLLAGVVYYVLGAALGLGTAGRLFMATAGLMQFKLIAAAYAGWYTVLPSAVFFPLLFAAVATFTRKPSLGRALALALVGALCLHGGQLQLAYYGALFALLYVCAWLPGYARAQGPRQALGAAGMLALAGLLGAGLAAYLLLPMLSDAPLVTRATADAEFLAGGHQLGGSRLLTLLHPEINGSPLDGSAGGKELWEHVAYVGLVPLVLALLALARIRRDRRVLVLAAGLALSFVLSLESPLWGLVAELVPGMDLFRHPARFLFLSSCFVVALAGLGLEIILTRLGAADRRAPARVVLAVVLLAVSAEGIYYGRRYLKVAPADRVLPQTDYQSFFAAHGGDYRIAPVGRRAIAYGWAAHQGLRLVTGFDSFHQARYRSYVQLLQHGRVFPAMPGPWIDLRRVARPDLLRALNVGYVVSASPLEGVPWLRQVAHFEDQPAFRFYKGLEQTEVFVYALSSTTGPAWFPERLLPVVDEAGAADALGKVDATKTAVIESRRFTESAQPGPYPGRPAVSRPSPGRLEIKLQNDRERLLVISENWHPGWRARLAGRELPVERVNLIHMGVVLPPGKVSLELSFSQPMWSEGLLVSLLSALCFLALLAFALGQRSARRRRHSGR